MVKEIYTARHNSTGNGSFEWDFVLGFLALLVIWLLVGHNLLSNLATGSPLLAYGIFLVGYSLMFFLLGQSMHQGLATALFSLVAYFIISLWSPPLMVMSGIAIKQGIITLIGTIILILSILFYIIASRLYVPFRVPITIFFVVAGIILLIFGLQYNGDPYCTSLTTGQASLCDDSGIVHMPGNMALASDSFLYLFFRNIIRLPHLVAWTLTYIVLPLIVVVVAALTMTRKQLSKTVL